jgi:hypothetical protein
MSRIEKREKEEEPDCEKRRNNLMKHKGNEKGRVMSKLTVVSA